MIYAINSDVKLDIAKKTQYNLLLNQEGEMKKPLRHSEHKWTELWWRIEEYGVRNLGFDLHVDPGVIRTWKSRGAIPESSWGDVAKFVRIPYAMVAGQLRKS